MKKKEVANSLLRILFWAVLSAGFLFLFSYSTSPFYANCWGHDSADYQVMGRGWADGLVPYRDLFELKGALLYLFDAIGYGISGKYGVFLIQILFFVFFLETAYQSCLLFVGRRAALVVPVCMLAILCRTFDEGNMTEDWSLPFLALSFLFVLRWAKGYSEGRKEHPPRYAFVYGFCFGCIFFLRVNNAVGICCCVFVITCYLIKDRAWKNLAQNVLAITMGALSVCLPFCAYFLWKGALYEMWYSMVLFGLSYVSGDFWDTKMKISLLLWAMAALSALHWWYDKKSPLSYMGLLSAVLTGLMLYKSRGYEHYYMILCAYVPLYCFMTTELWKKGKKGFAAVFLMGLVLQMGVSAAYLPNRLNRQERLSANAALNESLDGILKMIPQQDGGAGISVYRDPSLHPVFCVSGFSYYHPRGYEGENNRAVPNCAARVDHRKDGGGRSPDRDTGTENIFRGWLCSARQRGEPKQQRSLWSLCETIKFRKGRDAAEPWYFIPSIIRYQRLPAG